MISGSYLKPESGVDFELNFLYVHSLGFRKDITPFSLL